MSQTRKTDSLTPHPLNPRGPVLVDEGIIELAASIKSMSLLQPILITPEGTIVSGHRRHAAATYLKIETVPVIVRTLNEIEQLAIMMVENVQRQNLNCAQEGLGYLQMRERGLTIKEICQRVGISTESLKPRLAIAQMCSEAKTFYVQGQIPIGTAETVGELQPKEQVRWLKKAVEKQWPGNMLMSQIRQKQRRERGDEGRPPTPEETKQWDIAMAITRLYGVTDGLEKYTDLRPHLFKIADGIRGLEQATASDRKQRRSQ